MMRAVSGETSAPKELIHDAVGAKTHAALRVVHVLRTGVAADLGALSEARVNAHAARRLHIVDGAGLHASDEGWQAP